MTYEWIPTGVYPVSAAADYGVGIIYRMDKEMKNNEAKHKSPAMQLENTELDGFLGTDSRPLAEIIRADEKDLKKLNLTHQAIARRMSYFREAGENGLGEFVKLAPHFEISCEVARGFIPCPFGEPGMHRKTMVIVRNLRLRKEITFSDLNIHLIAAHDFYEGRGSPFRLEPVDLAQVLEIN